MTPEQLIFKIPERVIRLPRDCVLFSFIYSFKFFNNGEIK